MEIFPLITTDSDTENYQSVCPQTYYDVTEKYIIALICFARMNFSEQSHIEGEDWDMRCDEKSISSKAFQQ